MNNYLNKKIGGFTLIELMITVAVIAILASVAYPSYLDSVRKSRRVDATNGLLECAAKQERNYTINNTYLTNAEAACATQDGYYSLVVANNNNGVTTGCQKTVNGVVRFNCFTITATPVVGTSQEDDDTCDSIVLTYTGLRLAIDSAANDSMGDCWRK